jgi:hypothetical protein
VPLTPRWGKDVVGCAPDVTYDGGGLYKLNPVMRTHSLKGAWFQPLNLASEKLVSNLCFHMQLVPLRRVDSLRYSTMSKAILESPITYKNMVRGGYTAVKSS